MLSLVAILTLWGGTTFAFILACRIWCIFNMPAPFTQVGEDGEPVFHAYRLFTIPILGWSVNVHKIVKGDAPDCFHGHEGINYRFILKGGYIEEVVPFTKILFQQSDVLGTHNKLPVIRTNGAVTTYKAWRPFMFGRVDKQYVHRFDMMLKEGQTESWSLWIKRPKTCSLFLYGTGWRLDKEN